MSEELTRSNDLSTSLQELTEKELTPSEYFNAVKNLRKTVTDEDLAKAYDNCLEMLEKYKLTGQYKGANRLIFHLQTITREREIVSLGINTFVYKDDIEYYIQNVADDVVKIIDLESYEREIPDEVVDILISVKDKFDQMYVVFTDYTGETERKVAKERREKDPILFGCFKDTRSLMDRFYYIADWVDEYCDLTLDKMVSVSANTGRRGITHTIKTPQDIQELKEQLAKLQSDKRTAAGNPLVLEVKKPSIITRIKTFFNRKI